MPFGLILPFMRYVIYGAGAIGGTIGARLAQHGREVALIARGPHLEALRERDPGLLPLYCELALAGLPQAVERGLGEDTAEEISLMIKTYR